jgi:hypothetical protein
MGVAGGFLVLILLGVLDISTEVVLEVLDVFDDPIVLQQQTYKIPMYFNSSLLGG